MPCFMPPVFKPFAFFFGNHELFLRLSRSLLVYPCFCRFSSKIVRFRVMRMKTVYQGLAERWHLPLFLPTVFLPEIFFRFCKAVFVALFRFPFCESGMCVSIVFVLAFRLRLVRGIVGLLCFFLYFRRCLFLYFVFAFLSRFVRGVLPFPVFLALFVFLFRVCLFLHACPVPQMPLCMCCLPGFPVLLVLLIAIVF